MRHIFQSTLKAVCGERGGLSAARCGISPMCMVIVFPNKVSRSLSYNSVLAEGLARVQNCSTSFSGSLFPFFFCVSIFLMCASICLCTYVCRRLKKGSLKTQCVLYLLQNIHGKIFRLARMDCVALQLFLCVSLTVKMFFPNPVNPRH